MPTKGELNITEPYGGGFEIGRVAPVPIYSPSNPLHNPSTPDLVKLMWQRSPAAKGPPFKLGTDVAFINLNQALKKFGDVP